MPSFKSHVTETPAFIQQRFAPKLESSLFQMPETAQAVDYGPTEPVDINVILGVPLNENQHSFKTLNKVFSQHQKSDNLPESIFNLSKGSHNGVT